MQFIRQVSSSLVCLTFLMSVVFSTLSHASFIPVIDSYTGGGGPFGMFYGDSTGDVVGFSFTAGEDITVSALGIVNDPDDGVLDSAHLVGLWDATSQVLLGSTSVDAGDTLLNGFYYNNLTSNIFLSAGSNYVLGAMYTFNDSDSYISGPTSITNNFITNTQGVFPTSGNLGFVFPTMTSQNLGRIGPNMLAQVTVSEPSSIALLALALMIAGFVRRSAT